MLAGGMTLLALAMTGCSRTQEVAQKPKEEVPKGPVAYKISYPLGLDSESASTPKHNPLTEEKLKLGKRLYFDKSLSIDGSIACASCTFRTKVLPIRIDSLSESVGRKVGARLRRSSITSSARSNSEMVARPRLKNKPLGRCRMLWMPSMVVVTEKLTADPSYVAQVGISSGRRHHGYSYRSGHCQLRKNPCSRAAALTIDLWRATRVPWAKRHSAVICCSRIRLRSSAKLATWASILRMRTTTTSASVSRPQARPGLLRHHQAGRPQRSVQDPHSA